jgi:hypothetical protein
MKPVAAGEPEVKGLKISHVGGQRRSGGGGGWGGESWP